MVCADGVTVSFSSSVCTPRVDPSIRASHLSVKWALFEMGQVDPAQEGGKHPPQRSLGSDQLARYYISYNLLSFLLFSFFCWTLVEFCSIQIKTSFFGRRGLMETPPKVNLFDLLFWSLVHTVDRHDLKLDLDTSSSWYLRILPALCFIDAQTWLGVEYCRIRLIS